MRSNGGVASVAEAAERPVTLMLSGPAAGVLGASWAGALVGRRRLVTFDMGGTSADIAIATEAGVNEASARDTRIAGHPLLTPMFDIQTIGAGGGSIAYLDEAGGFRVGPRSAGADPGPACYGLGGEEPTITDAHLVLGRLDPERFLGGGMTLRPDRAHAAIGALAQRLGVGPAEAAEGVLVLANANMAQTIRSITVERGHDPRDFSLVAFGGAGPLHAAELAEGLGDRRGRHPAAPRHHVRRGPADERPALRPDAHGLRRRGRDRRRGAGPRLRGPRGHARGAPRARRRRPRGRRGRAVPGLPLRRPGLRAADPGARGPGDRRGPRGVPRGPPRRVRARVRRPRRDRQPARHGPRPAPEARAHRRRAGHGRPRRRARPRRDLARRRTSSSSCPRRTSTARRSSPASRSPARPSCCSSTPPSPSHRDGRPRRRRRASCSSPTPEGPAA